MAGPVYDGCLMSASLMHDFALILASELDGMAREIEAFPDDVSVWQSAPGVTNAAGNLALHLAGNVQHFIGALLGGTGYVRDREAEFNRRSGTRAEVVEELGRARAVVETRCWGLQSTALEATISHPRLPGPIPPQRLLLHLCAHAGFHLGQAGVLAAPGHRREPIDRAPSPGAARQLTAVTPPGRPRPSMHGLDAERPVGLHFDGALHRNVQGPVGLHPEGTIGRDGGGQRTNGVPRGCRIRR